MDSGPRYEVTSRRRGGNFSKTQRRQAPLIRASLEDTARRLSATTFGTGFLGDSRSEEELYLALSSAAAKPMSCFGTRSTTQPFIWPTMNSSSLSLPVSFWRASLDGPLL